MEKHHLQNEQVPVIVIMVPLPAQSHLNQLLRLSSLILSYDIPVHYVSSAIHTRQVKTRVHGIDPLEIEKIQFHDFTIPPFLTPPPNPHSSTKFPSHLIPSFEASLHLREPFAALLRDLSSTAKRIIIIHDALIASVVQDAHCMLNTETYAFHSVSAFFTFFRQWEDLAKPIEVQVPNGLPSFEGCFSTEMSNFAARQVEFRKFRTGAIHNTSRALEHSYIDLLQQISGNTKQWAINPLNLVTICKQSKSNKQDKCLNWLDKQTQKSVIYVSFGTTTSMTDEQIGELANGLEQSKINFIWVLRDADKGDISKEENRRAKLPKGFEERTEGVGIVIKDWASQLEILGHPSTGGFMSHCGWNSCLESISLGVPIAAWPLHSDQPSNAVLITEVLKIGLMVREWENREKVVKSSAIKEAVRRLMASEEGDQMRKRAAELRESMQQSTDCKELESFIAHITR